MNPRRLSKPLSGRPPQDLRPVIRFQLPRARRALLLHLSCCVGFRSISCPLCCSWSPDTEGLGTVPVLLSISPEPVETLSVNEVGKEVGMGRVVGSLEEESRVDRTRSR